MPPGLGGEIQLTDALRELCRDHALLAVPLAGRRYDVGDKFGLIQATLEFALARPELRSNLIACMDELLEAQFYRQKIGG
ncbi:MAG: UTP--glucose-1-phosphate uridylyltransferase [Pelotomaculum sp. PtaB.Bin104]|nr:MAG: UTP--glucose-1-phosphate uridylyltransferase [Pelotomaculum sp. PtaB.Bin104]